MLAPPSTTSKPCKYGHTSGRGSQNRCVECHRLRELARYDANPKDAMLRRAQRPTPPSQTREGRNAWALKNRENVMLHGARIRAKKDGYKCTLTIHDIIIPEFCPLLGIKIKRSAGVRTDSSPSLDRIDPKLGYTRGNIWVVSWRANRIKTNATLIELQTLAANLAKVVRTYPWGRT